MSYLLDTDSVASYLKGRPSETSLLATLADEGLLISLITYGELYEGIYYGTNQAKHEQGFRSFLKTVEVLSLSRSTMQRFASLRGELRRSGNLMSDLDMLIASTALQHDLVLVTRNVRHFERIANLKIYR